MELRRCPKCQEREVRLLDVPSQVSGRWHFRCAACGHAWTTSKDGSPDVTDDRKNG